MAVVDAPNRTDTDVDAILERMEALLRERGWCQWELQNHKGNLCLVGAAEAICREGISDFDMKQWQGIWRRINIATGYSWESSVAQRAVEWNNAPGRTIDEVCDMLQRARS